MFTSKCVKLRTLKVCNNVVHIDQLHGLLKCACIPSLARCFWRVSLNSMFIQYIGHCSRAVVYEIRHYSRGPVPAR